MKFQVEPLIESLRKSGTGKAKLQAVADIFGQVNDVPEFVRQVKKVVPPGTLDKINKWLDENQPKPEPPKADPPKTEVAKTEPPKAESKKPLTVKPAPSAAK